MFRSQTVLTCLSLATASLVTQTLSAQLLPGREFFGINRSIPMTVQTPQGNASSQIDIALFAPGNNEPVATASAEAGGVDLSTLFPILWTRSDPTLLYAQLIVDESPLGSAVVLQPMLSPREAVSIGRGDIQFKNNTPTIYSGIRAYPEVHIIFETSQGEIEFALRPDHAPNTCTTITSLVRGGYYTDIAMHRILPDFVVQFGDPTGSGSGGPGFMFDLEPSTLPHNFGILSMARTSDPDTNGSQMFICLTRQKTQALDGKYTAFGHAVSGADAIEALGKTKLEKPQKLGRPVDPPIVTAARLVPAPPYPNRPAPVTPPAPQPSSR